MNRELINAALEAYWAAEGGTHKGVEAAVGMAIEVCAKAIEPTGPRPCDCEPLGCYCQNYGDAQTVAAWDADMANANRIRALAAASREYDTMLATGVIPLSLQHRFGKQKDTP